MKILFFTENTHKGGLDTFLVNLINHWPGKNDELRIVCNGSHPGLETLQTEIARPCEISGHDIPVFVDVVKQREEAGRQGFISRAGGRFSRYLLFARNIIALKSLFRSMQPDRLMVVNGGHPGGDSCRAAIIAWRLACPGKKRAVYNFHNLASPEKWFDLWFEWPLDWLTARLSSSVIGVSRACARSLAVRRYKGLVKKADFIYNGITMSGSIPAGDGIRKELDISGDAHICLMLGTYESRKGHAFLLDAFREVVAAVPEAFLIICGYGCQEEIDIVEKQVVKNGLAGVVRLMNFRSDKERFLAETDILLVPSQAFESFGYTGVEAMVYRKPVVATTVGGIPEVVADGETGYCVARDDVKGFADRIIKLLEDATLRQNMGNAGFKRYKEMFTAARMSMEYAEVVYPSEARKVESSSP